MTTFEKVGINDLVDVSDLNKRRVGELKVIQRCVTYEPEEHTYQALFIDETKRDGLTDDQLWENANHPCVIVKIRTVYLRLYLKFIKAIL